VQLRFIIVNKVTKIEILPSLAAKLNRIINKVTNDLNYSLSSNYYMKVHPGYYQLLIFYSDLSPRKEDLFESAKLDCGLTFFSGL
jgi:hypothetical protein